MFLGKCCTVTNFLLKIIVSLCLKCLWYGDCWFVNQIVNIFSLGNLSVCGCAASVVYQRMTETQREVGIISLYYYHW